MEMEGDNQNYSHRRQVRDSLTVAHKLLYRLEVFVATHDIAICDAFKRGKPVV